MSVKNFAPRPASQGAEMGGQRAMQPVWHHSSPAGPGCQAPPRQDVLPLRLPDGRVAAGVTGDLLVLRRRGSLHKLRRPPGWCVDAGILGEAEALGARLVLLEDLEDGATYWAAPSVIRHYGFAVDRGHGKQICLPLRFWRPTRSEAERLAEQLAAEQLALPLPGPEVAR